MTQPTTEPVTAAPSRGDYVTAALVIIAAGLLITVGLLLWLDKAERVGKELRAYEAERIEAIENRYDITVDIAGTWSMSKWTIDGKTYACEVTDLNEPTIGLACMSGTTLTDFADLAETTR